jgi:gliding motility-associated-like protein
LKDKENIEELFREGLKDFQTEVDPSVWQGVQSGLGVAGASSGAAAGSVFGKMSLALKTIVGVGAAAVLSTGAYYMFAEKEVKNIVKNNKVVDQNTEKTISNDQPTIQTVEENNEQSSEKQSITTEKEEQVTFRIEDTSNDDIEEQREVQLENNNSIVQLDPKQDVLQSDEEINNPDNLKEEVINSEEDIKEELKSPSLDITLVKQDNQYVELKAIGDSDDLYVWDMGDGYTVEGQFIQYYYDEPGNYNVRLTSGEMQKGISLAVFIEGEIGELPNVFTPNNDGVNDYLFIENKGLEDFTVVVFDQNQEVVFTTNDPNFKWNGIHQRTQNVCEEGNYYYIITATDAKGNTINKHQVLSIEH